MLLECWNHRCNQRLRIPDGQRGILDIRCPTCGTKFRWAAEGSRFEIRELTMRCAVTDLKFKLVFARDRPTVKFQLRHIDPGNGSVIAKGLAWREAEWARLAEEEARRAADLRRQRGWLVVAKDWLKSGTLQAWRPVEPQPAIVKEAEPVTALPGDGASGFNTAEFEWHAVLCPHCKREYEESHVVHCGGCKELMCIGSIEVVASGAAIFRCHTACGIVAPLGTPTHFAVVGSELAIDPREREQLVENNQMALTQRSPLLAGETVRRLASPHKR